jgi:hypothetical protein
MQLLHKYVQIRSCIYLTSSSQMQLLSTKINTYTRNPHEIIWPENVLILKCLFLAMHFLYFYQYIETLK